MDEAAAAADAYVAAGAVDRAIDELARERADATLALTRASVAGTFPLGSFDHLVWPGATVPDALQRSSRVYGLFTNRLTLALEERAVAVRTQHTATERREGRDAESIAASALEEEEMRLQQGPPASDGVLASVRAGLLQTIGDADFGLVDVSRALGLSPRTVQRRMERQVTSLRSLADDV